MNARVWIIAGAVLAGTAVAAGAFGAHVLKDRVRDGLLTGDQLDAFKTAAQYQMYHAIGLVLVGLLARGAKVATLLHFAGGTFLAGMVLFSGSLYIDVLLGHPIPLLMMLVPVGGLLFIVGWLLVAVSGARSS